MMRTVISTTMRLLLKEVFMNNTLTKQNFAKFFGQAMDYKDFWKVQNEWENRFEQDYAQYCKSCNLPKKIQQTVEEKKIKDRPGLCWEVEIPLPVEGPLSRDLVGWNKRKPEKSKS